MADFGRLASEITAQHQKEQEIGAQQNKRNSFMVNNGVNFQLSDDPNYFIQNSIKLIKSYHMVSFRLIFIVSFWTSNILPKKNSSLVNIINWLKKKISKIFLSGIK
jgi:hypothetical protein